MGESTLNPTVNGETKAHDSCMAEEQKLEEVIEPIIISKELPDEEKVQQIVQIMKISQESFSGPIPHPLIIKGYKDVIPDAPERILRMAEKEQTHRETSETEMLSQNRLNIIGGISANKRSQIFAFIIVLILIGIGAAFILSEHETAGYIIFGTTITALAALFITGRYKDSSNKDDSKK